LAAKARAHSCCATAAWIALVEPDAMMIERSPSEGCGKKQCG
jgi:hypothetical protein